MGVVDRLPFPFPGHCEPSGLTHSVVGMRLRRIYISADHTYFGHHGKPPGTTPMLRVPEVQCVTGKGLQGDRFFDYKPDYKGQATLFSWSVYESLCTQFDLFGIEPDVFRRNLLVSEVDLSMLIGEEFELQGVRLLGTQEAAPCYWMNQAVAEGAEEAMQGNGGLRVKILSDGLLREESVA